MKRIFFILLGLLIAAAFYSFFSCAFDVVPYINVVHPIGIAALIIWHAFCAILSGWWNEIVGEDD